MMFFVNMASFLHLLCLLSQILDKTHVVKAKYPYKMLVRGELPSDVDPTNKQVVDDLGVYEDKTKVDKL